jgi:exodeoxyribonuclease-5
MEIVERIRTKLPVGMTINTDNRFSCLRHTLRDSTDYHFNRLKAHLQSVGVRTTSKYKHIPREYLYAPIQDRIDLLRGLMDTDGSIGKANRVTFSTTAPLLARDIRTLVQSLGGTAIVHAYDRVDKQNTEYSVNVKLTNINPFYLPRKSDKWTSSTKNPPSRFITAIESIGEVEQQCISVDAEDNLYLTDEFIVTHNTTIARHIAGMVSGRVLYACYTNKASLVLRRKGCYNAGTIHGLIYKVSDDKEDGEPQFILNPESPLRGAGLLVIDEVSMVGDELAADLLSFGTRVLTLGDPAQLPPVKGAGYFIAGEPDFMLTEIHRQALDNPIIAMSMAIRTGQRLDFGVYGDSKVIRRADLKPGEVMAADQVLCGLNMTRRGLNARFRERHGFATEWPCVGDRLVCLKNDRERQLYNGSLWETESAKFAADIADMKVRALDSDVMIHAEVQAPIHYFRGTEKSLKWYERKQYDAFDYGYALTCHKSQGSQWDHVMVFDESAAFREHRTRWLYTAITRAAEKVTVVV